MKKIDIHAHTTNRRLKDIVQASANLDTLKKEMYTYDVEKTIVLATYFPHKSSGISNFRMLNWIQNRHEFRMFGSLDFEHYFYQGINELTELAETKDIVGIKIYAGYQTIDTDSKKFSSVLSLASKYALPVMLHLGYCHSLRDETGSETVGNLIRPRDMVRIAKDNGDLNFIISHLANPFFDELTKLVRKTDNVFADMSGLFHSKDNEAELDGYVEIIKQYLGECGSQKLLFGTDFPVQSHEHSVRLIETAMCGYSRHEKQAVYYDNARRLLKWE